MTYEQEGCGNKCTVERQADFHNFTQRDYLHYFWNNVKSRIGPYKYFGGVLHPIERDGRGDIVYEYREI